MNQNTSGIDNVGVGNEALSNNVTGGDNTAIGCYSMLYNDSGAISSEYLPVKRI